MNEFALAYQAVQSSYEYAHVSPVELDRLARAGVWAVVGKHTAYCPITDASLPGTNDYIDHIALTREAAEAWIRETQEEWDDVRFWIA